MREAFSRIPALKVTIGLVLSILIIDGLDWSLPENGVERVAAALASVAIMILSLKFTEPLSSAVGLILAIFLLAISLFPPRQMAGNHIGKFTDLGRDVTVVGFVKDDPDRDSLRTRLTMELDSIRLSRHVVMPVRGRVRVTLKEPMSIEAGYGDRLAVTGWLRELRGTRNPGEFDFARYLSYRGIYGTMTVREEARVVRIEGSGGLSFIRRVVLPIKHHIIEVCHRTLSARSASVVIGLLVGERSEIPADVIQAFSLTGTVHILSLSGLHVVFISAILMAVFSFFHIPYLPRVVLTLACIGLYVLIGDSAPPIVRAAIMIAVVLIGTLIQRRRHVVNSLLVALMVVLCLDPTALFDIGLQLSFAAVLSIVLIYPRLERWCIDLGWLRREEPTVKDRAIQLVLVSVAAQVGTMPFTAYYFNKLPLVSLAANVAIVPLSSASMGLGFLSAILAPWSMSAAQWYANLNEVTVWLMVETARLASIMPLAYTDVYVVGPVLMGIFYIVLTVMLAWKSQVVRRCAIVGAAGGLAVLAWQPILFPEQRTSVAFLDVGQGDCAVVRTISGRTMLIDAGDHRDEYDYGERVVAPFLRKEGIGRLDYVVLTHPHDDHIGGIEHILNHFEVGTVVESGQHYSSNIMNTLRKTVRDKHLPTMTVRAGDVLAIDSQHSVYFLHPTPDFVSTTGESPHSINNSSVVAKMQCGRRSFLFMADAEMQSLERIQRWGPLLRSDVIKVGHHGSWNGTTAGLVAAVQARWAVVSVGAFNSFDHPSPATERLFAVAGADVVRTDLNGAVVFETDGQTINRAR